MSDHLIAEANRHARALKATDTRPLLTGKLTHAGLCRIDGELVDGVFIAVYREQIKACRRLPMYQEIELRIVAYK